MKALDLFELATRQSEYFPYTDKHLSEKKLPFILWQNRIAIIILKKNFNDLGKSNPLMPNRQKFAPTLTH